MKALGSGAKRAWGFRFRGVLRVFEVLGRGLVEWLFFVVKGRGPFLGFVGLVGFRPVHWELSSNFLVAFHDQYYYSTYYIGNIWQYRTSIAMP